MQRLKKEVFDMFAPYHGFLPPDLFFIVLEYANLAKIGLHTLSFTIFFPHLVKRKKKNVKLDEGGDARVSPK